MIAQHPQRKGSGSPHRLRNFPTSIIGVGQLYASWNRHLPDAVFPGGDLAGNSGFGGLQLRLLETITKQLGPHPHHEVDRRDVSALLGRLYHEHLNELDVVTARWLIELGRIVDLESGLEQSA